ncbi:MAG: polar amino acid transport system substrate-binding protein [Colwellia sp.]|jgi:polar amino acid transport system substrate-binding protein
MMNFIKIIFSLYFLPLSVLAQTNVKSDDGGSKEERITLTVAMEDIGYFPFYYTENGDTKGFSVDVLNYVEAHSKYDFEYIILPWPRALHLVAEGRVDLMLTLFKTSKREQTYHFIEPSYGNEINQLFTLMNNKFQFTGQLKQLTPFSIGTVREYSYGEYFDQATYLNKLPALTETVLLKLLLAKRIDMIISNPLVFNQLILKENMITKVKAIDPIISLTPVYMALTKGRKDAQEIKETIGELTQKLKLSPYYHVLLDKYHINTKSIPNQYQINTK